LVHYNHLLQDLEGEIRKLIAFLDIDVSEVLIPKIVDAVSFDTMKKHADEVVGELSWLQGGGKTFINKGTNGRWKDVLTDEDLKLYDAAAQRALTPDCRDWLEHGIRPSTD